MHIRPGDIALLHLVRMVMVYQGCARCQVAAGADTHRLSSIERSDVSFSLCSLTLLMVKQAFSHTLVVPVVSNKPVSKTSTGTVGGQRGILHDIITTRQHFTPNVLYVRSRANRGPQKANRMSPTNFQNKIPNINRYLAPVGAVKVLF